MKVSFIDTLIDFNIDVTNQYLKFGVPKVPKVNNNRENQLILFVYPDPMGRE